MRLRLVAPLLAVSSLAFAQAHPKPEWQKGHKLRVKIDSAPQMAAIYLDSKDLGIQGYTPSEFRLPKGTYKVILEAQGFKPQEQLLTVSRSQAFAFTLERQARPAVIDVRSGTDQSALGASITVDGTPVGTAPNQVEVSAGSHLLEVKRPGFNDYRDSVMVAEGERRTVVVTLVAQVKPGSILVTADVAGADVYIDGQRRDAAPALIGDLAEGDHTVEVRKDPMQPWKQLVRVVGGQQVKVSAQLQPAVAPTGSVRVVSATPMAEVFVDGEDKGPANAEIKDIRTGVHIIELRAQGFDAQRAEAEVKGGEVRTIAIDLRPAAAIQQNASIHVISPVPDAEVFIDGSSVGKAPVDKGDLVAGKHFVVVHKQGYADYKVEIELEPGKMFQVSANLQASGSVRGVSNPPGAEVFIDGTPLGRTPVTIADVGVGDHVVEIKLKDYLDSKQTVHVEGGGQSIVQADLQPLNHGPTVGELQQRQREQSSFSALVVDRYKFNVDIGVGDPYFLMARMITGIFKTGSFGMDIGIELRTSFYETDIGVRPRLQIVRADPVAVGIDLALVGGGGPTKRNSFTFELGPIITLIAGQYVHINLKPYLSVATDRLCPSVQDIKDDDTQFGMMKNGMPVPGSGMLYGSEKNVCKQLDGTRPSDYLPIPPAMMQTTFKLGDAKQDPRDRFETTRFFLQGSLEVAVSTGLSLWILVEGAPFQDQRQAFTSKFNAAYTDNDFPFYVRAGLTGKF
jgi:hypothetical protein